MITGLFVPLDVDFQANPKIIQAGVFAEATYIRSLALAKRTLADGKIHVTQLPTLCLGIPGKPTRHAQVLVSVDLWRTHSEGWEITGWSKRNASAQSIKEKADRKTAASLKANHDRWHVGPGMKPANTCDLCYPDSIRIGSDSESKEQEQEQEEEQEQEQEQTLALVESAAKADDFDRFWEAYPKKHGKSDATVSFAKAMKVTTIDVVLGALPAVCAKVTADGTTQFVKDPATWLNKQGWTDVVEVVPEQTMREKARANPDGRTWDESTQTFMSNFAVMRS